MFLDQSSVAWFTVNLTASGDLNEDAQTLRQALWKEGHRTWLIRDDLDTWSLAASVKGPFPQRQLEQALRQAGLSGSFAPLRRDTEECQKV